MPQLNRRTLKRKILRLSAVFFLSLAASGNSLAADNAETADRLPTGTQPEYHTPLAGEAGEAVFLGKTVPIPARDRGHLTSLTVGGSLLLPRQGTLPGVPVVALYLRQVTDSYRTRDVVGIFDNELEYDKRLPGPLELVGHFQNYTLPGDLREVVNNDEIRSTGIAWGTLMGSLGPGIRIPVAPFEIDNDLRLQLLGRVGYMYAGRDEETGRDVIVPPNTMLFGGRLRGRYDALRRNLLELPHQGVAVGFDLDYLHRDKWRNLTPGESGSGHQNFMQISGYFTGATGIPGLSERNRMLLYLTAGTTADNRGDRFNAFLVNGGPFPSEADEMGRGHYSGMIYQDVRATSYATASVGYRRELTFFLYLSLVGSYIWSDRATVRDVDQVVFRDRTAAAATASLDSAFLWNSSLHLAYSWDSGFIRGGTAGSGVLLLWNKCFD
jgi:hypothetical protein